jgi:hypothetical protein
MPGSNSNRFITKWDIIYVSSTVLQEAIIAQTCLSIMQCLIVHHCRQWKSAIVNPLEEILQIPLCNSQ